MIKDEGPANASHENRKEEDYVSHAGNQGLNMRELYQLRQILSSVNDEQIMSDENK